MKSLGESAIKRRQRSSSAKNKKRLHLCRQLGQESSLYSAELELDMRRPPAAPLTRKVPRIQSLPSPPFGPAEATAECARTADLLAGLYSSYE